MLATPAAAGGADPSPAQLRAALREPGLPAGLTGALVLDLDDGSALFGRSADKSLAPASTEKLTVALAALQELGAGFRIETVVLGHGARDGTVWRGSLVLKGFGDPSLHGDDLALLARRVRALGIRAVSGRVLGDESFFDRRRTGPGWKPSYYKVESAPLSALIVDRAWLDGRTRDEPARAAAVRFTRALEAAGVDVAGKPALGRAAASAVELAQITSPRLAQLVDHMNTESDNFVAEMLLKQVGARAGTGGTTAAGASVVRRVLAGRGVPLAGVRIADGSGLSTPGPAHRAGARGAPPLRVAGSGPQGAVRGLAGRRRRQRNARGPDDAGARPRRRQGQDRDDEPSLGTRRLRRLGLPLRDPHERQPDPLLVGARRPGSLRADPRESFVGADLIRPSPVPDRPAAAATRPSRPHGHDRAGRDRPYASSQPTTPPKSQTGVKSCIRT